MNVKFASYRFGAPYPLGHHRRGFSIFNCGKSLTSKTTVFSSPAAKETGFWNVIFPTLPSNVPFTVLASWFFTITSAVNVAEVVSGNGKTEVTSGSATVTFPVEVRKTSFQIPILRPRTVGIQSQPIVAWNVGLSAPKIPPLKSVLCLFFSLIAPI